MSARVRTVIVLTASIALLILFAVGGATQPRPTSRRWAPPATWRRAPTAQGSWTRPGNSTASRRDGTPVTQQSTQRGKTEDGKGPSDESDDESPYEKGYAKGYEDGYSEGFDAGYYWAYYHGGQMRQPGGYYFYPRGLYNWLPGPGSRPPAGPNGLYVGPDGMRPVY
ncbi:MAG: hypothetical protein ACE5O2_08145 [Armatimonadota bacterium]